MLRQHFLSISIVVLACLFAVFSLCGQQMPIWVEEVYGYLARIRLRRQVPLTISASSDVAIAATVRTHVSHLSNMFTLVLACGSPFYAVFNETYASYTGHVIQRDGPDAAVIELGRKLENLVKITRDRGLYVATDLSMFTRRLGPGGEIMQPIEQSIKKLELVQEARQRLANPNLGTAWERATLRGTMNSLLLTVLPDLCMQLMFYMERLLLSVSQSVSVFEPGVSMAEALLRDFAAEYQAVEESISALPWYDSWLVNRVIGVETQGSALRKKIALLKGTSKDALEYAERFVVVHENLNRLRDYIEWYLTYTNSTMAGRGVDTMHHQFFESELSNTRKLADTLLSKVAATLPWWDNDKVLTYPPHHVPQHLALNEYGSS